jgi:tRNA1Val (adenine37-N6)-methyltransferase
VSPLPESDAKPEPERIDDLQRNGCRLIQRPDLFCFGMDAVLLAAFASVKRGDRVLDLCSGNGVIPILMDARLPGELRLEGSVQFTGLEINSICVDMSKRSAQMNGQSERVHFLEGDVRSYEKSGLKPGSFDRVTVNPPYMTGGGGLTGGNTGRVIARHEVLCTFDDVADCASRALKVGGHLYLVHRPHRLGDIFLSLNRHHLAVKKMRMVHPFADKEANMVLIEAVKGGRAYVHVEQPLVIFQTAGVYTEEVRAVYG